MIQGLNEGRIHREQAANVVRRFGMLGAGDVLKGLLEGATAKA